MADLDSHEWFADWLKRQECDRVEQITLTPAGYADLITEAWEHALDVSINTFDAGPDVENTHDVISILQGIKENIK